MDSVNIWLKWQDRFPLTYQVTYQVRPHLIHELEADEAIGPSGHLVHEEAHLVTTKFVQIILEDVDTG